MGLAEPGPVATVTTPPSSASPKHLSRAYMLSSARTCGITGSVISLPSEPSVVSESSHMPIWQCASTSPGSAYMPAASMTRAPGALMSESTALMRVPSMSTSPCGRYLPAMVITFAFLISSN